jgi:hypothetical protein
MTIAQLINHLNAIEDKNKEIRFSDIATNYKYKIFCIDKKTNEIIIEDTGDEEKSIQKNPSPKKTGIFLFL